MDIFRDYDIRGVYPKEVDAKTAYSIGNAFARFIRSNKIVVGMDARISSPKLKDALIRGIRDYGADVHYIGLVSTPLFYFSIYNYNLKAGIMVTASHDPKEYNGFKLCKAGAMPVKPDKIEGLISKTIVKKKKGKIYYFTPFPDYRRFINSFVRKIDSKIKVLVDCGSGSAGITEYKLIQGIVDSRGMHIKPDGSFPYHEANPLIEKNTREIRKRLSGGSYDLGIAFDGDCDRIIFFDEKGNKIYPSIILALLVKYCAKRGDNVVYTATAGRIVRDVIKERRCKGVISKVGHSNIKPLMRRNKAVIAGERSGHFYYEDTSYSESSILTAIKIFEIVSKEKKRISRIVKPLKRYHSVDEINVRTKNKERYIINFMKRARENFPDLKVEKIDGITFYSSNSWFNIRKSNTEDLVRINIESKNKKELSRICSALNIRWREIGIC